MKTFENFVNEKYYDDDDDNYPSYDELKNLLKDDFNNLSNNDKQLYNDILKYIKYHYSEEYIDAVIISKYNSIYSTKTITSIIEKIKMLLEK